VPKTCLELLLFAILIWDQIRQAKADFLGVLLVPGLRAWLRYWRSLAGWQGRSLRTLFDPVGEIPQPIVSGPNRILIFLLRRPPRRAGKQLWRNRKEKKEWARRLQSEDPGLEVVQPHAAGIDVGNSTH